MTSQSFIRVCIRVCFSQTYTYGTRRLLTPVRINIPYTLVREIALTFLALTQTHRGALDVYSTIAWRTAGACLALPSVLSYPSRRVDESKITEGSHIFTTDCTKFFNIAEMRLLFKWSVINTKINKYLDMPWYYSILSALSCKSY